MDASKSSEPAAEDSTNETKPPVPKKFWSADQSLIATLALAVISLCALFVSIYQTRVLSMQQEVMAEQQRIMTESARAQLWPNVELSTNKAYSTGDSLVKLNFEIRNTGTGPAIIEHVTIRYQNQDLQKWDDMSMIDTLMSIDENGSISTSTIFNRTIQAGEEFDFLQIEGLPTLLAYLESLFDDGQGFDITVCYKSAFNESWVVEDLLGSTNSSAKRTKVDACVSIDSIAFTQ